MLMKAASAMLEGQDLGLFVYLSTAYAAGERALERSSCFIKGSTASRLLMTHWAADLMDMGCVMASESPDTFEVLNALEDTPCLPSQRCNTCKLFLLDLPDAGFHERHDRALCKVHFSDSSTAFSKSDTPVCYCSFTK